MLIVLVLAACSDLPAEAPASALVAEAAVERATLAPAETPGWPAAGAPLRAIPAPAWSGRPLRLVVDAGHGAPGNLGNTSVRCEQEADFTRRTQDAVIERLRPRPDLALLAGRPSDALRSYDDRIVAFDAWTADAVISLHSDTRAGDGWNEPATLDAFAAALHAAVIDAALAATAPTAAAR